MVAVVTGAVVVVVMAAAVVVASRVVVALGVGAACREQPHKVRQAAITPANKRLFIKHPPFVYVIELSLG